MHCLLLIVAALRLPEAFAGDNRYHVISYLGIEQGLSNNAVRCVFQDHKGFMWFGTYDGLNRFDGNVFKVFRNKFGDSSSLVNNWVFTIHEDLQYKLWVGTRQGLNTYDPVSGKFSPVYYQQHGTKQLARITAVVRDIRRDAKGNMFIATEGTGLLYCPAGSYTAVQVPVLSEGKQLLSYDAGAPELAANDVVWFFVQGRGLCRLDKNATQAKVVNTAISTADCIKPNGDQLWIGTPNGLMQYVISSNTYGQAYTEENGKLAYNKVSSLFLDKCGRLWVATNGGGISIIYTGDGSAAAHIPAGNSNYTLASASVSAIYEDTEGRKWIGTLRGGVNIIDPKKDRFQSYLHDPLNNNSLPSNFIFAFCEEKDGTIWVGTDGQGLSRWQRHSGTFTNYAHQAGVSNSLSDNFVTNIRCDKDQHIWISTFWGGVNRFDKKTNSFRHYSLLSNNSEKESKTVYLLYKDSQDNLWAGTFDRGALYKGALYKYDRLQDAFRVFDDKLPDLFTMAEDRNGQLWAGNLHSLIKIDTLHRQHQSYTLGNPVRAIQEDSKGRFWIGTEGGGLILFDRQAGKVLQRYTTAEGLCNNAVLNILEDEAGDLWISTFYGISRFNADKKIFTNFYQGDGLSSNQFNYNAALRLRSGELLFGGIKGLNIFRPANIGASGNQPEMHFTDIHVNNQRLGQLTQYIQDQRGGEIRKIKVPYNEAVFSFAFTALDFSTSDKIAYTYFMEGWDKNWNQAGNSRTATYTHLAAGHYTFRVKSTNAEGQWLNNEISLEIIVLPPWYATWWACLLYLLVVLAAAAAFITYKTKQRRLKYEIALAKLTTEKERELNEKKIAFFTNVSHEFRTPLTLIINPVKDLMEEEELTGKHQRELNTVYRNARRLLRLLDQLLLFRRADSEIDRLKPTRFNFTALCREVFLSFEQQAQSDNQAYTFLCDTTDLYITGDREKLEVAFFNLLSNALKYTPAGGRITLALQHTDQEVTITVTDTGYGIPAESAPHIFDKFYRSERQCHAQQSGFGIGLYLVKQFITLHGGSISFQSAAGEGTTFTVVLPRGSEATPEEPATTVTAGRTGFLHTMAEPQEPMTELTEEETEDDTIGLRITDKQTMLIVDDDEQIRQYLAGMFRHTFQLEEASNGKEGLEKAIAILPDVVISDIRMETMSGLELCREIKQHPLLNHIPVILLTGSSAEEGKLESAEVGSDYYLTKPFEKELLAATVQSVLQTRDNLRNYFLNEVTLRKNDFKVSGQYKEFVEKCIAIVEANLDNDAFNIKVLAREIGMSHSSVYKKIRQVSGESLRGFVRFIRLRKAAELMINTPLNVNEIGFQVGINDVKYFRQQFNKVFGMNPSDYIRRYRKVFEDKYKLEKIDTKRKASDRKKAGT
ncbi:Signal transduction histidine kinase [Chitinophaga jiangningensis]|uniref:histidine kinase n=2 Tax=Chitinophaga jiangningensis TaxID=1419482 RepID=A0A1M7JBL3_9BACT|nr:Signal transduction histidine kinase [Chitinophaga jiangningensis]